MHCLTGDHEVLTAYGWKNIKDITINDIVVTLEKNHIVYTKPTNIFHYQNHEGNMYHVCNDSIDLLVTENHRMWVSEKNPKNNLWEDHNFIEAKNLFLLGLDSINRKNYIQAEKYLSESYSIIPNRISILINYSVVLIKLNKINDAINILNKAKALEIDNEIIYLNLSNAYNELKNTTDAIKYINIAINILNLILLIK
jgi:tetratricopeptide (TPR) repeat protein